MPDRDEHLLQATRFEAFLRQIHSPDQTYREWVIIVRFHIVLHYVDAYFATQGYADVRGHQGRQALMPNFAETRAIRRQYQNLYDEARQARYFGTQYTADDLKALESDYVAARDHMRGVLKLP